MTRRGQNRNVALNPTVRGLKVVAKNTGEPDIPDVRWIVGWASSALLTKRATSQCAQRRPARRLTRLVDGSGTLPGAEYAEARLSYGNGPGLRLRKMSCAVSSAIVPFVSGTVYTSAAATFQGETTCGKLPTASPSPTVRLPPSVSVRV